MVDGMVNWGGHLGLQGVHQSICEECGQHLARTVVNVVNVVNCGQLWSTVVNVVKGIANASRRPASRPLSHA